MATDGEFGSFAESSLEGNMRFVLEALGETYATMGMRKEATP